MNRALQTLVAATLSLPTLAQDMVAVGWSGRLHALDADAGELADLASGPFGQNALARTGDGTLWSTARQGNGPFQFFLTRVDAVAGAVTFAFPSIDLRGLAPAGPDALWGLEAVQGFQSRLWRIDTTTGVHTLVGSTQTNAIQSLAVVGGVLWGWQWVNGLVRIDTTTGAASDPFAATAQNLVIQWLAVHPAHGLLGGTGTAIHHIDLGTGMATEVTTLPPGADLRGAEFTGFALPYGQGCDLGQGNLTLGAAGSLAPAGGLLTLVSRNHVPGSLRALAVGFSRDRFAGRPLPLLLDPLLGTDGCSLYAAIDVAQFYLAAGNPATTLSVPVVLPPAVAALDLFVQAIDFNQPWNPPGTSNGLMLHLAP